MAKDIYVSFSADTGDLEAGVARVQAEIKALNAELRTTANEMQKAGASMDSQLGVSLKEIGGQLAIAKSHMSEMRAELRAVGTETAEGGFRALAESINQPFEMLESLKASLAGLAAVSVIGEVAEKIRQIVEHGAEAAEQIERGKIMLAGTSEEVQRLQALAKITGTNFDEIVQTMARLQLSLEKVASGASTPLAVALKDMSLDAKDLPRMGMPEQIMAIGAALSRFADDAHKVAHADTLGRMFVEMLPMIDRNKEELEELNRTIDKSGVIMSEKMVSTLGEMKQAQDSAALSAQSLSNELAVQLAPAAKSAAEAFSSLVSQYAKWSEYLKGANSFGWRGNLPLITGADFGPPANIPVLDPTGNALREAMGGPGRNITVNRGKPHLPSLDLSKGAGGSSGADDASQIARERYQDEVDAAKRATSETQDILNNEVRQHQISWQEWAADSNAALEKEIAAIRAAANEAISSTALSSLEKQRIMRQESNAIAEIVREERDDQVRAVQEQTKAWESAMGSITSEINGQLRGLLSGSESWKTAMVSIFEDLALKAIEALEKIAIEEVAVKLVGAGLGLSIPGFAVGAWSLPSDTLAMVHKGEMIVPSGPAASLRDALSGGGGGGASVAIHPTTNVHIVSMDSQTVASTLKQNDHGLMKAIEAGVRNGAHLGLRSLRL